MKTKSTQAQAAAEIRKELKAAFPSVKFSVTSDSFTGGDAVRISYEDGPLAANVRELVSKYQYGEFNSMEDIYENTNTNKDLPQVKFVSVSRLRSDAVHMELLKEIQTTYAGCEHLGENDYAATHGQYISAMIGRLFNEREYMPETEAK